jgi:putative transposase
MNRFNIELSDSLVQAGRTLRFEERRGDLLDFRDDRDGQRLTLTDEGLADLIAEGKATLARKQAGDCIRADLTRERAKDFSLQPVELRYAARRRLSYVEAAQAGPRRMNSVKQLEQSIKEMAGKLGDVNPPHWRTVWRWLGKAGEAPAASTFVDAHSAKGNRTDRLDPRVREIVEQKIDEIFMKRPPVSVETLRDHVRVAIDDANKTLPVELACPTRTTLARSVTARPPRDVKAARFGEAAAAQEFDGVVTRKGPPRPLEVVELDHTKCDLFVVCDRTGLPIGRPTIAVAFDRCTRAPYGIYIGFDPPSVHTVMQCLRNGMLPKTYIDRKVRDGEWKLSNRWSVCGKPKGLLLDRGLENLSDDLEDFAAEVGFHLQFAPRKTGKYKGGIERFLKTITKQLMHEQRGTTFSNVVERDDYDAAKNAVITYDDLVYALHRYLLDVYACRPHKGLRKIPAKYYEEMVQKYPVQPIEDIQKLNMLFGRIDDRTLERTGIVFQHIVYYSQELVALLADPEFRRLSPDRSIKFRYDPGDLEFVRVYDPVRDTYLMVPACERDADYVKGLSIWQHRLIVKHWNKRLREDADYGLISRAKVEIRELFERAWQLKGKIGSRSKAARHDGVGRRSMAGADEATSPEGSADHAHRAAAAKTELTSGKSAPTLRVVPSPSEAVSTAGKVAVIPVAPVEDAAAVDVYAELGIRRKG